VYFGNAIQLLRLKLPAAPRATQRRRPRRPRTRRPLSGGRG
jgi:hypothetical protein